MAKRVLYAAIHAWTSPLQVGSQAIAAQFAKNGWDVAYVSAPLTPLHWLRRGSGEYAWRMAEHRAGGGTALGGRLWHYVPFALLAPDNRPPLRARWLFENWHRLTTPNLPGILRSRGFGEVDLLVLDTLFQPFWLDLVPHRRSVARLADYNAGFPGYGGATEEAERKIVSRVDCVVTAAAGLDEVARGLGAKRVLRVPNGIDASRFEGELPPEPAEYAGWRGPIAVYVGAMAEWVDLSLVEACARSRPDVLFALVGPGPDDAAGFPELANVHFLGRRPPETIPAYLRNADVGLIPFRSPRLESLISRVNPLKLYEYLAAGLPVVSTRWAELEGLASPARLCATTDEFVAALDGAIAVPGDPEHLRAFAREADWSRRVAPLLDWAVGA